MTLTYQINYFEMNALYIYMKNKIYVLLLFKGGKFVHSK